MLAPRGLDCPIFRHAGEDPHDPTVGLINGGLSIPANLLRTDVFDRVTDQVLQLLKEQIPRVDQPIHALLLVEGFAGSEHLKQCAEQQFGKSVPFIARLSGADTAKLRSATQYGLAKRSLVSMVMCILPRQRLTTKFCRFSESPSVTATPPYPNLRTPTNPNWLIDFSFIATLYTSDSMRYTDEDEILELCKWPVDLTSC
ncbi:hypothetical protein H1R20_g6205, partial [Candolleomyces eurysporus]